MSHPNGNKDDMLFIGDTYETDIVGAHNVGLKTVWINRNNASNVNGISTYQIKDITELRKLTLALRKGEL